MGVIFGPDAFTVGIDANIDAYPSGSPDYAYSRGSGSNLNVNATNDNVAVNVDSTTLVARVVNLAIPNSMTTQETRGDLFTGATPGAAGLALRYSASTRGYVCQLSPGDANEVQISEDNAGYTLLASINRGLVANTTYAASFRAVGVASGTLLTLIIGGAFALTFTDTTAPASGAPGIHEFRDPGATATVDNFLVDDLSGFPLVAGIATTNGTSATTSPVINLPSGIRSGETLLMLIRNAAGGTITFPNEDTDWIQLFEDSSDASNDTMALAWRKANETEGATTTATFGTSGKFAAIVYRILGAIDPIERAPEFAALVTGSSATPDPGAVTPTGGAKKYLLIWMGGWEGIQSSPPGTSMPAGYNSPVGADSGAAGGLATNCRVATGYREAEVSSEDPGSWTISASDDWTATVVAVHPASVYTLMPAMMT